MCDFLIYPMRFFQLNLLFWLLSGLCLQVYAQGEDTVEEASFVEASADASLVYLQTNKGLYVAGEVIWLKGYVVEAGSLRLRG